jgi:polyisoprenoid-binding protein YceI
MTTTSTGTTYAIDPAHSSAEFVVRHLMIAKVRGRFTGLAGSFEVPAGATVPSVVSAALEVATISTSEAQRDGHLKSPDFFDAETIAPNDDGFHLHGDLTIRDQTHPVTLAVTYEGETVDPWGNKRLGFEAHGKISRKDFGLTWNQALETGGVAVGDEVKIELSIEGIAQK